jgi:hypothetical protein
VTAREIGRMHHDIAGSTLVIFEDLGDMPQEQDSIRMARW